MKPSFTSDRELRISADYHKWTFFRPRIQRLGLVKLATSNFLACGSFPVIMHFNASSPHSKLFLEPDSAYTSDMSALLSRMAAELFVLTEYCLEDGRTGLQTAMTRYLVRYTAVCVVKWSLLYSLHKVLRKCHIYSCFRWKLNSFYHSISSKVSSQTLSSLPDPSMQAMIMQTMWSSMQDFRNDISVRETSLMPFVIRKEKRKSHAKKTDSPTMERNARVRRLIIC